MTKPLDANRHHELLRALPLRVPTGRRVSRDALVTMLTFSLLSSSSGSTTGAGVPSVSAGAPTNYDDLFKAIVIIMLTVITGLMYRLLSSTSSNMPAAPTPMRASGEGGGGGNLPPPEVAPGSWAPSAPVPADFPRTSANVCEAGAGDPSVSAGTGGRMATSGVSAEVATQTEPMGIAVNYWDWKSQDLHAEARRRGLVPVHMKTNGIRQLIEDDLNTNNLTYLRQKGIV